MLNTGREGGRAGLDREVGEDVKYREERRTRKWRDKRERKRGMNER